ncbi:MAG: SAM-dependent methyltransferase [Gammaproteobacteria bacterium]|nr:SAM-dependent methyltransferase [Gammaproteobacteria bacterium]MBT5644520.1 SAM-dependent methyltransferase [Gammaproteobacteria bacterium]MBT5863856.1 SAM-dependent methyltransferase [Gammaproteobacteria bacterium]MBT6734060.1 SAM-dependent methyltransferase [Gammaproteobacteria bacterium]MBT7237042.1 SAM-dependent methyltransferase [Gammaproteobacteria bacterium]|tara:strand:+ start:6179 stop:6847 length:669 start_codon:yes stop_codon:yes gene_type:complete
MKHKDTQLDPNKLRSYLDLVGYKESAILRELRDETAKLGDISIMQIGAAQGALIQMICSIGQFTKCIEIGVFTGYSSICIAEGMSKNGKLFALDKSREFTSIAEKYWNKSKLNNKIDLVLGDAIDTLDGFISNNLENTFDLVFIDADKNNYLDYYEKSLKLIRSGGIIIIDNTIWKGKVLNTNDNSSSTKSIKSLNDFISKDIRVDHCLISIYDGMTLCMKK